MDDLIATCGAFLSRVLGRASLAGGDPTDLIRSPNPPDGALASWHIGAARPVVLYSVGSKWPVEFEQGKRVGRAAYCGWYRNVIATRPRFLVVGFDWRGPKTWIPWPALHVSALGIRSRDTRRTDLDWLLIESWHRGPALLPDSSTAREYFEEAQEKARRAARSISRIASAGQRAALVAVGAGTVLLLAWGYARRNGK